MLSRTIKDLDDVRLSMKALSDIREQQIRIDMTLGPVEEAYGMLQKFQVSNHWSVRQPELTYPSITPYHDKSIGYAIGVTRITNQFKSWLDLANGYEHQPYISLQP